MASHFSAIGFPVKSQDEYLALAQRVMNDCTSFDVEGGRYLHWGSRSGAELWLQIDTDNIFIGMNPHYSGKSLVPVRLSERVIRPKDTVLDGALRGWAIWNDDDSESFELVFDVPDFGRQLTVLLPANRRVQIAAFAQEVSVFDSPKDYTASQTGELKFAPQSFFPSGLLSPDLESIEPPEPYAIFSGHIVEADTRRNELTGSNFFWVLVETLGAVFDVVIDPGLLSVTPKVGGVLSGSFWLSGRIVSDHS